MSDERTRLLSATTFTTIPKHPHLGKTDIHTQFIALVGVPASNLPNTTKSTTTWPKSSLYGRATRQLRSQSFTYQFTAALSNTLLLSQVVLGAAVTGLGASASSHILITVIGALNTVIAGLVAYLKSRGQPMRARMYRDDLERVVDEIENSEVMFLGISNGVQGYDDVVADGDVTVRSEVARLTRLYDRAVRNNTANNPDSYVQGPGMDGLGIGGPRGVVPLPPAPVVVAATAQPSPATTVLPSSPAVATPAAVPSVVVSQDPDASPASAPLKRPDTPKPGDSTTTLVSPSATPAPAQPRTEPEKQNDAKHAREKDDKQQDTARSDGQAQAGAASTSTVPPTAQIPPQARAAPPAQAPETTPPQTSPPTQAPPAPLAPPADSAPPVPPPRDPDESPASAPLRRRTTPAMLPTVSTPAIDMTNAKTNDGATEDEEAKDIAGREKDTEKDKENAKV